MSLRGSFSIILIAAATTAQAYGFEPFNCPRISACAGPQSCADGIASPASVGSFEFSGVRIPLATTNFPIITAAVRFKQATGSTAFLAHALELLCRPVSQLSLDCDSDAASGFDRASSLSQPVWESLSLTRDPKLSVLEQNRQACRIYIVASRTAALALAPEVTLQSHPLSEEGILLRATLARITQHRPKMEIHCASLAPARQCIELRTYFEDLRFAHILADKRIAEGRLANAWHALKAAENSALLLAATEIWSHTPDGTPDARVFGQLLTRILSEDWIAVRNAITRTL